GPKCLGLEIEQHHPCFSAIGHTDFLLSAWIDTRLNDQLDVAIFALPDLVRRERPVWQPHETETRKRHADPAVFGRHELGRKIDHSSLIAPYSRQCALTAVLLD